MKCKPWQLPDGARWTGLIVVVLVAYCSAPVLSLAEDRQNRPGCEPIAGLAADDVSKVRFVLFGEQHGTSEEPEFFGDVVCALALERPVVVALERDKSDQSFTDEFLRSPGSSRDKHRLLQSAEWRAPNQDGRTSVAMFKLLDRLRRLRRGGLPIDVAHFMPEGDAALHPDYYDLRMAAALVDIARAHPHTLVLALMGNIHASKGRIDLGDLKIVPAASHLPPTDVLSFVDSTAGSAWQCRDTGCGTYPVQGAVSKPRGVRVDQSRAGYDGQFSPGSALTASPPAVSHPRGP